MREEAEERDDRWSGEEGGEEDRNGMELREKVVVVDEGVQQGLVVALKRLLPFLGAESRVALVLVLERSRDLVGDLGEAGRREDEETSRRGGGAKREE